MTKLFFFLLFTSNILFAQTAFEQGASVQLANKFLNLLNADQKNSVVRPFDDATRKTWANVPLAEVARPGIELKDLADSQRVVLHRLLRTILSQQGYQKILFIIQYDEATHERLGRANSPIANRYGNQNYCFTIFGTPQEGKMWAWKFEGHHISLNITYSPNGVTCTPMFVGINPALLTTGPYAGYHLMFEENEFGNQLFNTFSDKLKVKAIVSPHPKNADVMTHIGKEAHLSSPKGISFKEMNRNQQELVEKIIRAWVENLNPNLAKAKMNRILKHKKELFFTWQGTQNSNDLHYYSLQTPTFIIEFTNRDGGLYHYHTLWRDLGEDSK